jgi:hypothetical protein
MKFQKPSYPYILFLIVLFSFAALHTPDQGSKEIDITNEQILASEADAIDNLFLADANE